MSVPLPGERQPQLEQRILLKTVTTKDAAIASQLLQRAGIESHICRTPGEVVQELERGAGALLLAEEVLSDASMFGVARWLQRQPQWSDLPVLVIAGSGLVSNAVLEAMDMPANITVIERPLRIVALISAVRSALRARRRQYELRAVLDGLRLADQRKTEFIATLAHELRNPLAPLSTALTILNLKPHTAEEAKPHYAMMQRQVSHMVRLIDDLMEVSRITRGKIELKMETIALERIVKEAAESSRPVLEAAGHTLTLTLPPNNHYVRGDGVRLTQVFTNLLNNAAKYTPGGGRVDVAVRRAGERVSVRVSDNGVGIPVDMLGAVFDIFVQVGHSARAAQGGLGIGLTLVKSLVELHGGSVRANSAGPGCGTEVVIELPLAATDTGSTRKASAESLPARLTDSILIVDDNRDAADSLSMLLAACGARPMVAYNGARALELLSDSLPTVGIFDIGMPGMDGYELARRVRGDPRHRDMLLLALTGWGQSEDRSRIADAGFDHHFLKPLDTGALVRVLHERVLSRTLPREAANG